MAVTSYANPGNAVTLSAGGDVEWIDANAGVFDVTDISTSNDFYGAVRLPSDATSERMVAYDFSFALETYYQIDGVEVRVECRREDSQPLSTAVQLGTTNGMTFVANGSAKSLGSIGTTDAYIDLGGAADLWSGTLTAEDINGSDFGVSILIVAPDSASDVLIDHVQMRIYYTDLSTVLGGSVLVGTWGT